MAAISVHLLGTFHMDASTPTPALDNGKARELFCYLLLHRDRPIHRDLLAGALWGGNPNEHARKYLRQALWQLQSSLAPLAVPRQTPWLDVQSGWIRLDSKGGLWLDVSVLEHASAATRGVPGRDLSAVQAELLRSAVTLYRGDLLEGWYQDWCLVHRETMQASYLDLLDKLIAYSEKQGRYEEGIAYGGRALHVDRAHERTHRQMMRLYYRNGDRTRALRQYERCATALHEELGISPARDTTALCEQIRQERWSPGWPPDPGEPASGDPETLSDLANRLRDLQASLAALEQDVRQELHAAKSAPRSRN
jgi:DNA-binding SARP family transcriptional activator